MIKTIVFRRLKAFCIDYLVILIYAGFLLAISMLAAHMLSMDLYTLTPFGTQLLGFATLTLPVILYFTLFENSSYAATPGKRFMQLRVVATGGEPAGLGHLLLRNCIKFLPWELAHLYIFQLMYYIREDKQPPDRILAGLIITQAMALLYLVWMAGSKTNRSIYERLSGTKVILL